MMRKGRVKRRTAMAKQGLGKHRQGFEHHSNGEAMNGSDMLRKKRGNVTGRQAKAKI